MKINNSNAKSPISSKKYYGTVPGLEFSKKLRKKTFNPKKIDLGVSINAFNIVGWFLFILMLFEYLWKLQYASDSWRSIQKKQMNKSSIHVKI